MKDTKKIDIHRILDQRREIAIVWGTYDVKEVRPDLTDDQAWEVLQQVEIEKDVNLGVTWLTLKRVAEDLFGQPAGGNINKELLNRLKDAVSFIEHVTGNPKPIINFTNSIGSHYSFNMNDTLATIAKAEKT